MSSKRRYLCFFVGGLLVVISLLLVRELWREAKPLSSGTLTLPDGAIVRIVGATYGTNHVLATPFQKLLLRMPNPVQQFLQRRLTSGWPWVPSRITPEPALVVWLKDVRPGGSPVPGAGPPPGSFRVFLADASGFASGNAADLFGWWGSPQSLAFSLIPRRDREMSLEFYYQPPGGQSTNCGRLTMRNPLYGRFPQWQPEPLPTVRRTEDVEMRVGLLSTGHGYMSSVSYDGNGQHICEFPTNRPDGQNRSVCVCTLRPRLRTNEVWTVVNEIVSDATGNSAHNTTISLDASSEHCFSFGPSPWPGESAWKLKCELKRTQGFAANELFSFRDVPLGELDKTNRIGWMTNFNGAAITLESIARRTPITNNSWSSSESSSLRLLVTITNELHMDLIAAQTDLGTNLQICGWSKTDPEQSYFLKDIPLNAKTANFTFALQRSRWVEFTLRPQLGAAQKFDPIQLAP